MKIWQLDEINFSCAHFYRNDELSEQENRDIFGKCYTEYGHGHDYKLRIESHGTDQQRVHLKQILSDLREELDHQHLNFVIDAFKTKVPTSENLTLYFAHQIQKQIPGLALRLHLWETPSVGASVQAESTQGYV